MVWVRAMGSSGVAIKGLADDGVIRCVQKLSHSVRSAASVSERALISEVRSRYEQVHSIPPPFPPKPRKTKPLHKTLHSNKCRKAAFSQVQG